MTKMKKHILTAFVWIVVSCFLLMQFRLLFLYISFKTPNQNYFGDKYLQILYPTGIADRFMASAVLHEAEEAFYTITTRENAEKKFGKLGRYCITDEEAISEEHELELISADFYGDRGYMWISYYQAGYDQKDAVTVASGGDFFGGKILVRWELTKNENGWKVTSVSEHP